MNPNLEKKLLHLTLIEDWYESRVGTASRLALLFNNAIGASNVFSSIYVSIRNNPQNASQEASETFTYYNVGFLDTDIAAYFNVRYGANYFGYNYNDSLDVAALRDKIAAIYNANKYKYMKLVEVLGYRYNPLYNVDGTELFSLAESLGDTDTNRKPTGTVTTVSGTENNNAIGESTTTFYKNPYDNNSTEANVVESKSTTTAITSTQGYSEDYQEKTTYTHNPAYNYTYDETEQKWKPNGVFTVTAKDNAFGSEFSGSERYYAEKRIRQGNIGVTKSTELLRDQREIVKFNILDEFFNDLRREIVVGIY